MNNCGGEPDPEGSVRVCNCSSSLNIDPLSPLIGISIRDTAKLWSQYILQPRRCYAMVEFVFWNIKQYVNIFSLSQICNHLDNLDSWEYNVLLHLPTESSLTPVRFLLSLSKLPTH